MVATAPRRLLARTSASHSSAVVSASTFLSALLGAAQALLLAFIVGEGKDTDAFLAAYALYTLLTVFATSLRSSVVPLIGHPQTEEAFRARTAEVLSRIIAIAAAVLVIALAVSPLIGQLVARGLPSDARWTAVVALLLLAPAACCHIYAAAASAALGTAQRFFFSATLYVATAAIALGCSALLLSLIGVLGAALGVLGGAGLLAFGHAFYLRHFDVTPGWRLPSLRDRLERRLVSTVLAGAAVGIALQANLTLSLSSISGDPGAITAFTYAYFIVALVLSLGAPALAFATLPALVGRIAAEGTEAAARHVVAVAPYGFAVLAPLLAVYCAYGQPLLDTVFGGSLTGDTTNLIYELSLPLAVAAVPTALVYLTAAATLAVGRAQRLFVVALASVLAHAVIVFSLSTLGAEAVAIAQIASASIMASLLLSVTFGRAWLRIAFKALSHSTPAFALSAVALFPRLALGADPGLGSAMAAALVSGLVYLALASVLWRGVATSFFAVFRRPQPHN